MRTIVLAVVLLALFALTNAAVDMMAVDQDLINSVNSNKKALWVAGENDVFKGKTLSQVRKLLGTFLVIPETSRIEKSSRVGNVAPPKEYDIRSKHPTCIEPIRNQGKCGSCWAFAATRVVAERVCQRGAQNAAVVAQSPQDMVSCDKSNLACRGGYLDRLWKYYEVTGTVTDACFPYVSGAAGVVPACPKNQCVAAGHSWVKTKAKSGSTKNYDSVEATQEDVIAKGSVLAGFMVYRDFLSYKSGVYHHVSGGLAGGHAVTIEGWGVEAGTNTPYWIIANSWGEAWGMKGYFWIKRGNNECEIEDNLWAADA